MSPILAIMLFSPKSCTDRELLKSPKCRNVNRKLDITWHQCISKIGPNRLMLICEMKITQFLYLWFTTLQMQTKMEMFLEWPN